VRAWSPIYTFATSGQLGISAMTALPKAGGVGAAGSHAGVFATDFALAAGNDLFTKRFAKVRSWCTVHEFSCC